MPRKYIPPNISTPVSWKYVVWEPSLKTKSFRKLILKPEGLSSNGFFLFESLLKTKCFGTILEKLYHFKVPKKVKTGEKCPKFQRF